MIANFFRKTKPVHAIFISIIFLVYFLLAIILVEKPDYTLSLVARKLGLLFLFLILFFLIRFINRKNQLSSQNSYVLLILAFLFGIFPKTTQFQNIFISHFVLLFAFRRIYSLKTNKNTKEKLFDSGILIGIASLFYSWSVLFFGLIIVALFNRKQINVRNICISLLGYLTLLFIVFTYYFFNNSTSIFFEKLALNYSFNYEYYSGLTVYVPIIVLFVLIITSIIVLSVRINAVTNDLKTSWIIILTHLFLSIIIIFFTDLKEGYELILTFFPLAIILANFLQLIEKMIFREIILLMFVGLSIFTYLG